MTLDLGAEFSFQLGGNFEFVSLSFQPSKAINRGAWSL